MFSKLRNGSCYDPNSDSVKKTKILELGVELLGPKTRREVILAEADHTVSHCLCRICRAMERSET